MTCRNAEDIAGAQRIGGWHVGRGSAGRSAWVVPLSSARLGVAAGSRTGRFHFTFCLSVGLVRS